MFNLLKKIQLRNKLNENGFPWIKVKKDVIKKYRDTTNKNHNLTDFEIQYKLNREFYSSSTDSINEDRDICYYGYLKIVKDNRTNTITEIHNSHDNRCGRIKYKEKDKIKAIYISVFGGGEI